MMIYDETSIAFIQRATQMLCEILAEIKIPVRDGSIIYNNKRAPINIVVFEGKELGHFNHNYLQIGLNKRLIYSVKDSVVRDILRHELAHYLTRLKYGSNVQDHGIEFKKICKDCGFSERVVEATMSIEEANNEKEGDLVSEKIVEKVKKLLSLAKSSNAHEAELATVKANEILLRHNIDMISEKREAIYVTRVLSTKRKNPKMTAIYSILSNFVVRTVINKGSSECCIEVSGTKTNVMLASYIAEFLDRELDRLWKEAKKEHGLSGTRSMNSFFYGIANGFNDKMKRSKTAMSESDQMALVVIDSELKELTKNIYTQLKTTYSRSTTDAKASALGRIKGNDLSIHQGVNSGNGTVLGIGYSGK